MRWFAVLLFSFNIFAFCSLNGSARVPWRLGLVSLTNASLPLSSPFSLRPIVCSPIVPYGSVQEKNQLVLTTAARQLSSPYAYRDNVCYEAADIGSLLVQKDAEIKRLSMELKYFKCYATFEITRLNDELYEIQRQHEMEVQVRAQDVHEYPGGAESITHLYERALREKDAQLVEKNAELSVCNQSLQVSAQLQDALRSELQKAYDEIAQLTTVTQSTLQTMTSDYHKDIAALESILKQEQRHNQVLSNSLAQSMNASCKLDEVERTVLTLQETKRDVVRENSALRDTVELLREENSILKNNNKILFNKVAGLELKMVDLHHECEKSLHDAQGYWKNYYDNESIN